MSKRKTISILVRVSIPREMSASDGRRVHYSVRTNRHLVKIKRRWRAVNIDTLTTVEPEPCATKSP